MSRAPPAPGPEPGIITGQGGEASLGHSNSPGPGHRNTWAVLGPTDPGPGPNRNLTVTCQSLPGAFRV